jgi:hypothetical protein
MLPAQTPTQTPPAAAPRPTPELPPGIDIQLADRVIYLFVSDQLKTNDIADRLELSLHTVGLIIHSPYGVETRALLENLDEIRTEIHTRHQRMRAMAATAELCETAVREETRRLAAAAIIRGVPYYPSEREQRTTPAKRRSSTAPIVHQPTAPAEPSLAPRTRHSEPVESDNVDQSSDIADEAQLAEEAAAIAHVELARRFLVEAERLRAHITAESTTPRTPAPERAQPAPGLSPRADTLTHPAAMTTAPTSPATPHIRARDAPQAA